MQRRGMRVTYGIIRVEPLQWANGSRLRFGPEMCKGSPTEVVATTGWSDASAVAHFLVLAEMGNKHYLATC
jgi:hypothetical protein